MMACSQRRRLAKARIATAAKAPCEILGRGQVSVAQQVLGHAGRKHRQQQQEEGCDLAAVMRLQIDHRVLRDVGQHDARHHVEQDRLQQQDREVEEGPAVNPGKPKLDHQVWVATSSTITDQNRVGPCSATRWRASRIAR